MPMKRFTNNTAAFSVFPEREKIFFKKNSLAKNYSGRKVPCRFEKYQRHTAMEYISSLLSSLSGYMPLISYSLLALAGFNLPISEDIVILLSGALGATYTPNMLPLIYVGCFAGAYTSDLISYSLGRFALRGLAGHRLLQKIISLEKIEAMENYFARYGSKTLLFGRFIPFGVRNVIFMTAGFSKMRLITFMLIDLIPLSITSSITFYLGIKAGSNYRDILPYLDRFKEAIGITALIVLALLYIVHRIRQKKNQNKNSAIPRD